MANTAFLFVLRCALLSLPVKISSYLYWPRIKNALLPLQVLLCNIKKLQTPCHYKKRTKKLEVTSLVLILLVLIIKNFNKLLIRMNGIFHVKNVYGWFKNKSSNLLQLVSWQITKQKDLPGKRFGWCWKVGFTQWEKKKERRKIYLPTLSEILAWDFNHGSAGISEHDTIISKVLEEVPSLLKTSEVFRRTWP